jgi:hypothetical protein
MANDVVCKHCGWTETAHDMAKHYRKAKPYWDEEEKALVGSYWWCLHEYAPQRG